MTETNDMQQIYRLNNDKICHFDQGQACLCQEFEVETFVRPKDLYLCRTHRPGVLEKGTEDDWYSYEKQKRLKRTLRSLSPDAASAFLEQAAPSPSLSGTWAAGGIDLKR